MVFTCKGDFSNILKGAVGAKKAVTKVILQAQSTEISSAKRNLQSCRNMKELLIKQLPTSKRRPSLWRISVSSYKSAIFSTVLTHAEFLVPFLRLKILVSAVKVNTNAHMSIFFYILDILF